MRTIVMLDEQGGKGNSCICSKWCNEKAFSSVYTPCSILFCFFFHSLLLSLYYSVYILLLFSVHFILFVFVCYFILRK